MFERLGEYDIDIVLEKVKDGTKHTDKPNRIKINGEKVKMNSQRLENFKQNGCTCVECGLEATYFGLDLPKGKCRFPHFNLYAKDKEGKEILFTKDHIFPVAEGGLHIIDNYQTMCQTCNTSKGKVIEYDIFDIKEDGKVYYEDKLVGDTEDIHKRPTKKKKKKKPLKTKKND